MNATKLFATAVLAFASGCATLTPLTPLTTETNASGAAQISLTQRDGRIFHLDVRNTSDRMIVVDRNAITLTHGPATEQRTPGGFASTYVIPPHGHHAVNVKFAFAGLRHGEAVRINVDRAILVDGQAVDARPLELRVD